MTRLFAAVRSDARLQVRYKFYHAGVFVTIIWVAMLRVVPHEVLTALMPVFLFFAINITTFYFIAGSVLFEKGEGTLEALVVTPLRVSEYLFAKVSTLTILAIGESLIIVVLAYGIQLGWVPLLAGAAFMAIMYALMGFVMVARYDSVSRFLIPSGIAVFIIQLPFVPYFGLWESWIWYLWPTAAPLALLESAFRPIPRWEVVYGMVYSVISCVLLFALAQRTFHRFVIKREGIRL